MCMQRATAPPMMHSHDKHISEPRALCGVQTKTWTEASQLQLAPTHLHVHVMPNGTWAVMRPLVVARRALMNRATKKSFAPS